MFISFSPQRRDASLSLSRSGDVLTINGEAFDLSVVPEGATLPREAISSDWFAGPVERVGGELHISAILPHGPNPSQAVAFPQPITVNEDGPIAVPSDDLGETGE
ncbi:hypothetical protein [Nitratireductor sp. OM-1]|uniref:hypothetical protein n=1 Tax=Nitratireductor sp. OM-1 TaxID=1756988 RepID=UPI000DE05982|nr:hypothetical protein [Nitratireductor sp. OM-1]